MINWEKDADGVVILTMDDPNQGANTMNALYQESMAATVDRLEAEKDDITGVVLTSAKKTFFAGGDLKDMTSDRSDVSKAEIATQITETTNAMKKVLRRLETLGKPVVAAINGAALGGGLEIALHTHYRIAADVKGVQIGLPEATLGLLPGGGGVVRTVRLLGIQNALMGVLLQGQRFNPTKAKETGLVNEVVGSVEELIPAAKAGSRRTPPRLSSRSTSRATRSRAVLPPTRRSPRTSRPCRPCCASRSRVPTCRLRAPSWPRPSRVPTSTSTPPTSSRPATSSRWSPARSHRT